MARRDRSMKPGVQRTLVPSARPRNVIGDDERGVVEHPRAFPWRHVCRIEILWPDGRAGAGTGWLASPGAVVTAGHCVFSSRPQVGWARSLRLFFPDGRTFELDAPDLRTTERWGNELNDEYDYGAILLPEPVDDTFLEARALVEEDFLAPVFVAGYPLDRPANLWSAAGPIFPNPHRRRLLRHAADTEIGESGAPLLRAEHGSHRVVGIHIQGESDAANLAVAFIPAVVETIGAWAGN